MDWKRVLMMTSLKINFRGGGRGVGARRRKSYSQVIQGINVLHREWSRPHIGKDVRAQVDFDLLFSGYSQSWRAGGRFGESAQECSGRGEGGRMSHEELPSR